YFHAYVLLHSRPVDEMRAVVDGMTQGQRDHFFDELPEEAWAHLTRELETGGHLEARGETPVEEPPGAPAPAAVEPIIQARQIEKSFQQPDGRQIQVIA